MADSSSSAPKTDGRYFSLSPSFFILHKGQALYLVLVKHRLISLLVDLTVDLNTLVYALYMILESTSFLSIEELLGHQTSQARRQMTESGLS
jgi:hypothetical protein